MLDTAVDRLVAAGYGRLVAEYMGPVEALTALLEEDGLLGYTEWMIQLIQDIWGIDLRQEEVHYE